MKQPKNLEEYEYEREQEIKRFKSVFKSPQGEEVLNALKDEFYNNVLDPGPGLEFAAGQRDVVLYILTRIGDL